MDKEHPPSPPDPLKESSGKTSFWQELKRRHVVRVALVYAVVGWIVMQVASVTFEGFGIPIWAFRFVMLMVILGFPISVVLAWAFELTPAGIKTTKTAQKVTEDSKTYAKKRNWFSLAFAAAAPTLIFGVLALYFYFQAKPEEQSLTPDTPVSPDQRGGGSVLRPGLVETDKSIAVLPLTNMSPDEENAFFADGVQEDILTKLSRVRALRVISRTSTLRYRSTVKSLAEIGKELGVRYLVEGSVRRAGNQVRVTVQLIDAHADEHIWAESYDRRLDNIFAIQSAIAQEIAGQLRTALSPEEIKSIDRPPTENLEAYDYYVKLRQLVEITAGERPRKIEYLEKAVALDPEFAEAWAQLALTRILQWNHEKRRNDPELLAKAHYALNQAKRYGPDLPHIRHAQSFFAYEEDQDIETSISLLLEALAIEPGFRFAQRMLANRYRNLGRLSEAQHYAETFLSTDPLPLMWNVNLIDTYQYRRNWDQARALIQANLERGDRQDYWQIRLVHLDYLQTGDRQSFISGIEATPGFLDNPNGRAEIALIRRDYLLALQLLEEWESDGVIDYLNGQSLNIGPTGLAMALIHFEQEDNEQWLMGAKSARTQLEAITELDPKGYPYYWSRLAICYALEGDRERMETATTITREKTRSSIYKYRFQVECEAHIAICHLVLGDHDKAIETLEAARKLESPLFLNRELDLWFIFDRLRGNPQFDKLLED